MTLNKPSYNNLLTQITRLKTENELLKKTSETQLLYHSIINSGQALIWTSGIDKKCNYFNTVWLNFTGRTFEQEIGDGWTEGVHPDDLKNCIDIYVSAFNKREKFSMEYRLRNAMGQYRWIQDDGTPNYNSKGEFIGYIGHCLDITERKQATLQINEEQAILKLLNEEYLATNEELQERNNEYAALNEEYKAQNDELQKAKKIAEENEQHYKMLFEASGTANSIFNRDCKLILQNTLSRSELGGENNEFLNKTVFEIFGLTVGERVFERMNRVFETGIPETFETQFNLATGIKWYRSRYQPVFDHNNYITAIQIISQDITQIKTYEKELVAAKEKAEESDRLKSSFLANMSHEIRTPMNAIIGFSDFLLNPSLNNEKKLRFTQLIKQRSFDLLHIIEDILDVSKLEVGQMIFKNSEFCLFQFLTELYEYYNNKKKAEINLKLRFPENYKAAIINTDNYRLKQVFTNLLDNALKFTNKGRIEFGCNDISNNLITFFVTDTGIGIPPEKQEIVFDRFRQADDALTAMQYGGTGLGLSIVKGLIEQFNGKVWLQSEPNIGSTFYFSMPSQLNNTISYETKKNVQPVNYTWQNKTILIVEDDEANTEYIKELLSYTSVVTFNAYTGKETLQMVELNPKFDLILMDIQLPDTNGLNLTKTILQKFPTIKIIAQTAYASAQDEQDCINAGCNSYISKPIIRDKLFTIIDKLFSE